MIYGKKYLQDAMDIFEPDRPAPQPQEPPSHAVIDKYGSLEAGELFDDETPRIDAWPVGRSYVVIFCPYCGRMHVHGNPWNPKDDYRGTLYRQTHCHDGVSKLYILRMGRGPFPPWVQEVRDTFKRTGRIIEPETVDGYLVEPGRVCDPDIINV